MNNSKSDTISANKLDFQESNKFQGLRYYAISSEQEVIAIESSPDDAYFEAISQGEMTPVIIGSNTVVSSQHQPR
jgi:hypothetical protein